MKDGKSYPVIRITHESFPKVFKTRRLFNDGSLYFGPYPDAGKLDTFLDLIQKLFPLRRCGIPMKKLQKPCLYYHIGLCCGPCAGLVTEDTYQGYIEEIKKFLNGSSLELEERIKKRCLRPRRRFDLRKPRKT